MTDPRSSLAVLTSKVLTRGLRMSRRGGGTALPGLVANYIDPQLLDKLSQRLPAGTIVVAGTNGKTTTSRMLAAMLAASGRQVVHNRSGSNLVRGISSAFAEQMSLSGTGGAEIGVIESDENAFPDVVRRARPRMILLLNLFRDQLDRYGELETIASAWAPVIQNLGPDALVVVNADDPNLAALVRDTQARVVTFGLEDRGYQLPALPHASDATVCRFCESRLNYTTYYLSHLGEYECPACGWRRPTLQVAAQEIAIDGPDRLAMNVDDRRPTAYRETFPIEVGVGGLYNAYNALAATAAALALGIRRETVHEALLRFQAAFGRLEKVAYAEREWTLALAKNPVGFNEVLRMLATRPLGGLLAIGINDLDADGRDVSWLWDVDFEALATAEHATRVFALGIRGSDLAVRLKYAGVPTERLEPKLAGLPLTNALDGLIAATTEGDRITLLLTYSAMLELRHALAERGAVAQFWEQ